MNKMIRNRMLKISLDVRMRYEPGVSAPNAMNR
jgi:hypothetical protein